MQPPSTLPQSSVDGRNRAKDSNKNHSSWTQRSRYITWFHHPSFFFFFFKHKGLHVSIDPKEGPLNNWYLLKCMLTIPKIFEWTFWDQWDKADHSGSSHISCVWFIIVKVHQHIYLCGVVKLLFALFLFQLNQGIDLVWALFSPALWTWRSKKKNLTTVIL